MTNTNKELLYPENANQIGGKIIYINPTQPTGRINPFEIRNEGDKEEAMQRRVNDIKQLIQVLKEESLTDVEQNTIEKILLSKETHTIRSFQEDLIKLKEDGQEGLTFLIQFCKNMLGE